ncbi:MAG: type II toxin-antitoxin system HicB family antitoxin [Lachnospiraceae bacterium]|nr:type II toxin-antitoxin system HicB family antitoxin [Lachnospiraceae bacterium]
MRKITYLAVMEPSEDGGYAVFFPDVPGCITYGEDFEAARELAEEAVGLHIYSMECDGETAPEPSQTLTPEETQGCLILPITIFPDLVKNEMDNKRVKTNITIPAWLKRIAEEHSVNYSRILETALMDYLGLQKNTIYKSK